MFSKNKGNNKKNNDYFLDGLKEGIGVFLFCGPIFLVGILAGWFGFLLFVTLCAVFYWVAIKVFETDSDEAGRSEFWWAGSLLGGAIVLVCFFIVISIPWL